MISDYFKYSVFDIVKYWWKGSNFIDERKIWVTANSNRTRSNSWSGNITVSREYKLARYNSFP
jgi:hypothetical protein